MNREDMRNMTDDDRIAHEVAMGCPTRQSFEPQDLKQMINSYNPVLTDEDLKTVNRKRWWQFWK